MFVLDFPSHGSVEPLSRVLANLSRDDLLSASAVSRGWRAAARLDDRFYLCAGGCDCHSPRPKAASTGSAPTTIVQYAREHSLNVSIVYDATSSRGRTCHWDVPRHGQGTSNAWLAFFNFIRSSTDHMVKLCVIGPQHIVSRGLFGVPMPTLRSLVLDAGSALGGFDTPIELPRDLFGGHAPSLHEVALIGVISQQRLRAFINVTTLRLIFTSSHTLPDPPIDLISIFPALRHLHLESHGVLTDLVGYRGRGTGIDLDAVVPRLESLSFGERWGDECGQLFEVRGSVPAFRVINMTPDNAYSINGADLLRDVAQAADLVNGGAEVRVMHVQAGGRNLLVAQAMAARTALTHTCLRVAVNPPASWFIEPESSPLFELGPCVTWLSVPLDEFIAIGEFSSGWPCLRTLVLFIPLDTDNSQPGDESYRDLDPRVEVDSDDEDADERTHLLPRLENLILQSTEGTVQLEATALTRIVHGMGLFVRDTIRGMAVRLELRGVDVPGLERKTKLWKSFKSVVKPKSRLLSPEGLDRWLDGGWYNSRL